MCGLAHEGKSDSQGIPRDLRAAALMGEWSDTHLVGAWQLLNPVLSLLTHFGRRAGIEDKLHKKYGHTVTATTINHHHHPPPPPKHPSLKLLLQWIIEGAIYGY
jgi:hypothetical protein